MGTEIQNEMPHNGDLLEKYVKKSGFKTAPLSRKMNYSESLLRRLWNTPSLRTHIWWKLGLAINHNIFADFAAIFPVKYKTAREHELEAELNEVRKNLEAELYDVKKELEVYRRIFDKTV